MQISASPKTSEHYYCITSLSIPRNPSPPSRRTLQDSPQIPAVSRLFPRRPSDLRICLHPERSGRSSSSDSDYRFGIRKMEKCVPRQIRKETNAHTHSHARTHTDTHTNTLTLTHTRTHARANIHTHARKHIHTHTRTHAHTHAHTHTHTHTNRQQIYKETN